MFEIKNFYLKALILSGITYENLAKIEKSLSKPVNFKFSMFEKH